MILFLLGCTITSPPTDTPTTTNNTPPISQPTNALPNMDQGQQHPPIPADNPMWNWDAKSFVPDYGWYGEHNWADVRMRAVGHIAVIYRDMAKERTTVQDWNTAAKTYHELATELDKISTKESASAEEIRKILLDMANRDAQIVESLGHLDKNSTLSTSILFPETPVDSIVHWRIEYWKLLAQPDVSKAKEIQQALLPFLDLRTDLAIDGFQDFANRHRLRSQLFTAYVATEDPILLGDYRWDYWRPEEIQRQALALGLALELMGGDSWQGYAQDWWTHEEPLAIHMQKIQKQIATGDTMFDKITYPSVFSEFLLDTNNKTNYTIAEFGRLPTGDSLIDVAGQPGPLAIGSLLKLDVTDPSHASWIESVVAKIEQSSSAEEILHHCQDGIAYLEAQAYGSKFYNIKQMRNACTRHLAKMSFYKEAHSVYQPNLALHHQDWACPNREGLVLAILGRLQISAPDSRQQGIETLERAKQATLLFLQNTELAQAGTLTEPKPPFMKHVPVGKTHPPQPNAKPNSTVGVPTTQNPHKVVPVPPQ